MENTEELKGTCRECGQPITYRWPATVRDEDRPWRAKEWRTATPADADDGQSSYCGGSGSHKPREWCCHRKGDDTFCFRRIKPEDILSEMYACGVHMRHERAAAEAKLMRQEAELRNQERAAERKWMAEVYEQAHKDLIQIFLGDEYVLKELMDSRPVSRDRSGEVYSIHKSIDLDMVHLRESILNLLKRAKEEFNNG